MLFFATWSKYFDGVTDTKVIMPLLSNTIVFVAFTLILILLIEYVVSDVTSPEFIINYNSICCINSIPIQQDVTT